MADKIIITEDEKPKPPPEVVVIAVETKPKIETVVTEKTTTVKTK